MLWQFNKAGDLLLVGFLGEKHVVVADDSDIAIGVVCLLGTEIITQLHLPGDASRQFLICGCAHSHKLLCVASLHFLSSVLPMGLARINRLLVSTSLPLRYVASLHM